LGGNRSKCEVKVTVKDPDVTPPVISGAKNVSVKVGDTFDSKKGVTVTDDYDKEPTLTIDDKNLNTKTAGKYTVYYTATDKSGNKASVKRTVTVVNPTVATTGSDFDRKGIANQPYLVAVNRAMCTITVYGKDADGNYNVPIKAMVCSVGRSGHQTPTGRYNTTNRYDWRLMVDGSYGRYAIRINGSIMFHSVCYYTKSESNLEYEEYNKLGSPASLGCIRLCLKDIKWLYDNCPKGFPTVIYDDTSTPGPLGKPSSIKIDVNDVEKRGYDPTDWSPNSPWNK
jgi:lipoprotein-anchoring transpeptidase ErfK/SrfK